MLQSQAVYDKQLATAANAAWHQSLDSLSKYGASTDQLATGTYIWDDIDVAEADSSKPMLTNGQCVLFNQAFANTSQLLRSKLVSAMASVLPVPATSIVIATPTVMCNPAYPLQSRDDQFARFAINVTVTAQLAYFAKNATYVNYSDPSADRSGQHAESGALLGQSNVRAALQNALRGIYLSTLQSYYGLHVTR